MIIRTGCHRGWRATFALLVASALIAGCSGSPVNAGGDTTCEDYLDMSRSEQKDVISTFLEDEGRELTGMNISLHALSAIAFCNTAGKPDSKIREIDGK